MNKHGWTYKKLGEVATIISGSTPKTNIPEYWDGAHFWVTPAELGKSVYIGETERTITDDAVNNTNLTLLPVGTVLLSSRAPIGKIAITTAPMYCNQGFKNIVCSEELNNKFTYYFIDHIVPYLQSLGRGATFKEISKTIVENVKLPVPSMEEQEAIVDELDEINETIELLKQQVSDLDKLEQSTFYAMFGDPVANEKGWEVKKLGDLAIIGTGATPSRTKEDIYYNGNIPWVKTTEVHYEDIEDTEEKITAIAVEETNCKIYPEGTILMAMYGQGKTRGQIAKLKIRATTNQACAAIDLSQSSCEIDFIYCHLKLMYEHIRSMARGGNQANLNLSLVNSILIINPPLTLQQEFAAKVEAIESAKVELNAQVAEMQTLLVSRMDYYFD